MNPVQSDFGGKREEFTKTFTKLDVWVVKRWLDVSAMEEDVSDEDFDEETSPLLQSMILETGRSNKYQRYAALERAVPARLWDSFIEALLFGDRYFDRDFDTLVRSLLRFP